ELRAEKGAEKSDAFLCDYFLCDYLAVLCMYMYLISIRQRRVQCLARTAPQADRMAISRHVPIVLLEVLSKPVMPGAIANKIKEFCGVGIHSCFERAP